MSITKIVFYKIISLRRFPNSLIPPELVFLSLFCVVEALNIAGLAWAPRLEDEQKYGVIWYKSICQSPKIPVPNALFTQYSKM